MLPEEPKKTYETLEYRPKEKIETGTHQFVYSFIEFGGVLLAMLIVHLLIKYKDTKCLKWMKISPMFLRMFVKDLTGAVTKTAGDEAVKKMKEKDINIKILDTVDPKFFKKYGDIANENIDVKINKDVNKAVENIEEKNT